MPTAIEQFQRLKFAGIQIPYQSIQTSGGMRDHVHEYPHIPGGSPEKLGRRLYTIRVQTRFDNRLKNPKYAKLYPNDLGVLMALFEDGVTDSLVIPGIGEIRAYCVNWTRTLASRLQSGEDVELEFREDQESAYLVLTQINLPAADMATMLGDLDRLTPEPKPSIFQIIRDGINGVLAYRDQALMYRGAIIEKIEELKRLCDEADATLDLLKNPINYELIAAFQRLWQSVNNLAEEIAGVSEFRTYVTPRDMTAQDVSMAIFGDTLHVADVLNLNAITDPYAIQAGTSIRYFR
jgi:hypothetical protein